MHHIAGRGERVGRGALLFFSLSRFPVDVGKDQHGSREGGGARRVGRFRQTCQRHSRNMLG